jgi:hypothetical protein
MDGKDAMGFAIHGPIHLSDLSDRPLPQYHNQLYHIHLCGSLGTLQMAPQLLDR